MNRLDRRTVAISISDAPDRERLGFPKNEVERILLSVCSGLIRAGARVSYGGNLDPEGYTFKIFRHMAGAFGSHRGERPFIHVIPESVWQPMSRQERQSKHEEMGGIVESLGVLDNELIPLYELPEGRPQAASANTLTAARFAMARISAARVIMGGKMGLRGNPEDHYSGRGPGIVEEADITLEHNQPLVVLGAFGGAARDVAIALELLPESNRVPRGEQDPSYERAIGMLAQKRHSVAKRFRSRLCELAAEENAESITARLVDLLADQLSPGEDRSQLLSR